MPTGPEHFKACDSLRMDSYGEFSIRYVQSTDIPALTELIRDSMNAEEGLQAERTFAFHLACQKAGIDDGRLYWLLAYGDTPIGMAGLHHYAWGPAENVWLAWFAVARPYQRRKLGTMLLNSVLAKARQIGYRKLLVETYSSTEFLAARYFYCANGFTELGRMADYLPSGDDMVVFGKSL